MVAISNLPKNNIKLPGQQVIPSGSMQPSRHVPGAMVLNGRLEPKNDQPSNSAFASWKPIDYTVPVTKPGSKSTDLNFEPV